MKTSIPIITIVIKKSNVNCFKSPPLKKNNARIAAKSTAKVPMSGCKIKNDAIKALIIRKGKRPNLNEPIVLDFDSSQAAKYATYANFKNSAGCKEMGPSEIQRRAPA